MWAAQEIFLSEVVVGQAFATNSYVAKRNLVLWPRRNALAGRRRFPAQTIRPRAPFSFLRSSFASIA